MERAIVVGGGAAGMFAAIKLAGRGFDTTLIEKNEKLGKKLFITGKGRCNFTNDCEPETFFENVISNPRFLYSSYYGLTARDLKEAFESWGLETKVERGQRAFPASDHAYDVIDCLKRQLKMAGVRVLLNTQVTQILTGSSDGRGAGRKPFGPEDGKDRADTDSCRESAGTNDGTNTETPSRIETAEKPVVTGVEAGGRTFSADRVIIATGGLSYPATGSTGDGMKWAEKLGHTVTPCRPSLVALNCAEHDLADLQGLSLKNVTLTVTQSPTRSGEAPESGNQKQTGKKRKKNRGPKELYSGFGEMMFTHFGVTGPLVLTASAVCGKALEEGPLSAVIDLKPAVTAEDLDRDLTNRLTGSANRDVIHAIRSLYPASIVPALTGRAGIPAHKKAHDVTKEERQSLAAVTKAFALTVTGPRGYNEAIITQGGVSVKEIDPATMASKLVDNLYFAGEVLDLDALTGGFNLQIAWSTGNAAGSAP